MMIFFSFCSFRVLTFSFFCWDRPTGELRPLVAAVHQMVLRDDRPPMSGALMS